MAWDPLNANLELQVWDRLKCCQAHLQNWNNREFNNVNKIL